jgi:hypothetical protein
MVLLRGATNQSTSAAALHRGKTVSKLFRSEPLGLALSEKQIPQIVETIRSVENSKKLWRPSRCV